MIDTNDLYKMYPILIQDEVKQRESVSTSEAEQRAVSYCVKRHNHVLGYLLGLKRATQKSLEKRRSTPISNFTGKDVKWDSKYDREVVDGTKEPDSKNR
jgi:hypothetical protein